MRFPFWGRHESINMQLGLKLGEGGNYFIPQPTFDMFLTCFPPLAWWSRTLRAKGTQGMHPWALRSKTWWVRGGMKTEEDAAENTFKERS